MAETYMVATPLSILLTGIQTLALIYCGTKYLFNASKRESSEENLLMYGFGLYFILHAISLFLWGFLSRFALVITYNDGVFLGNLNNPANGLYFIYDKIAFIFLFLALSAIFFSFERTIKKTKYSLTLTNLIVIALITIIPYDRTVNEFFFEFIQVVGIIFSSVDMIIFLFIMVLLSKWSRLEFKAISIIVLYGFTLIMMGMLFVNENVLSLNLIPLFISPSLVILGSFISVSPTILNSRYFSNALAYWYILGFFVGSLIIGMTIFTLFFLPLEFKIMLTFSTILLISMVIYMIKDIKSQQSIDLGIGEAEREISPIKVLETFTRPQNVTEEEVTYYKEQKICLVCKGNAWGFTFICSECETLYCEKCARTLSNLENACWVCDAPFDEKKPVTPYKKEENEVAAVEVSEQIPKKLKNGDIPLKKK